MNQGEALEAAGDGMERIIALLRTARADTEEGAWGRRSEIERRIAHAQLLQQDIYGLIWYERRNKP